MMETTPDIDGNDQARTVPAAQAAGAVIRVPIAREERIRLVMAKK
jgi:hypothetical protein